MTLAATLGFAAIIWLAYTTQAIAGFGSTAVGITLSSLFLPVNYVLPIVVALNLPFCAWLVWRNHQQVDAALLKKTVLPFMLTGLLVGALLGWWLRDVSIRRPLGVLIIACALLDLWRLQRQLEAASKPVLRGSLILISGLAQGFAASGGPVLAAALAGSGLPKQRLRASLSVVWLLTNSLLTIGFISTQRYSLEMAASTLLLLPVTALALWSGERLHQRVSERQFRLFVDLLLLVAAMALLR